MIAYVFIVCMYHSAYLSAILTVSFFTVFSVVRVGVKVNSENMGRPSIECRFLSRVEGRISRVEGRGESRV